MVDEREMLRDWHRLVGLTTHRPTSARVTAQAIKMRILDVIISTFSHAAADPIRYLKLQIISRNFPLRRDS